MKNFWKKKMIRKERNFITRASEKSESDCEMEGESEWVGGWRAARKRERERVGREQLRGKSTLIYMNLLIKSQSHNNFENATKITKFTINNYYPVSLLFTQKSMQHPCTCHATF